MAKVQQTHERKGAKIKNLVDNTSETFPSIAKAKRASRAIQQANGGLGCGSLAVVR